MDAETITIHKMAPEQIDLTLGYVRSTYQRKFGTSPESIWQDCLVAENHHGIVGVMAMGFSERGEQVFEILGHFLFDPAVLVHPLNKYVSLGRWVAAHRGTGRALMFAAAKYALALSRTHSISCSKPDVCRYVREQYGLSFNAYGFEINPCKVPEADKPYFLGDSRPLLCIGSLKQWYDVLEPQIPPEFDINV